MMHYQVKSLLILIQHLKFFSWEGEGGYFCFLLPIKRFSKLIKKQYIIDINKKHIFHTLMFFKWKHNYN